MWTSFSVDDRLICSWTVHVWIGGEVGAVRPVWDLQWNILLSVPMRYFFCGSFLFLSCVCCAFVRVCLFVPCGHLLGKGWPLGSRLWCLTVSLSLSLRYPGSGMALDCIDSWSLHPYLLYAWTRAIDMYASVCRPLKSVAGLFIYFWDL